MSVVASRKNDGQSYVSYRKLLRTRLRTMVGAFVISKGSTNIDPTRIMLYKTSGSIFTVSEDDVSTLMSTYNYSAKKAMAYYECVSQIPLAVRTMHVYTNLQHLPAYEPRNLQIDVALSDGPRHILDGMRGNLTLEEKILLLEKYGRLNAWYADGADMKDYKIELGQSLHALEGPATDTKSAFDHRDNPNLIRIVDNKWVVLRNTEELTEQFEAALRGTLQDSVKPNEMYWFANSWEGNSWTKNFRLKDGGPPCFWTKDLTAGGDPFSNSWRVYDSQFPNRGWRVTYDKFPTYPLVLSELKRFLRKFASEPVVHIWIQGKLGDLGPQQMVDKLRLDVDSSVSTKGKINVIIMPAGTGKTTYSMMYPELVDVDTIINSPEVKEVMKLMRRRALETENWEMLNNMNGELVNDALKDGKLRNRILLIHHIDTFGDRHLTLNVLGGAKLPRSEMLNVAEERDAIDPMWSTLTKKNWTESNVQIMSRSSMNAYILEIVTKFRGRWLESDMGERKRTPEYRKYWYSDVFLSRELWDTFASTKYSMIPVIPWRVSNIGMRSYHPGLPPQLFPPTAFLARNGINYSLNRREIYHNYSEYVNMIEISDGDKDKLDFGWRYLGEQMYSMEDVNTTDHILYKVEDSSFFHGLGSVVTSMHACYGFGRSNTELMHQHRRKVSTGHGTSGHMLASIFAYQSHFLWYLYEISINLMTKQSIYISSFDEPEGGVYHSEAEYKHAIQDIKLAMRLSIIPEHAQANSAVCEEFVRKMF